MRAALPRNILFDLDGTLIDSLPGIEFSVAAAFASCHIPLVEPNLRKLIGPPIRDILARAGGIDDEMRLTALEQAFRSSYDSEGWRKTACFPGAEQVLQAMRQCGHRLFVVSNKPRHISLRILDETGIAGLFESILTLDSSSPRFSGKTEMIRSLLETHRIVAEDCMIAGDTMEDAKAAFETGISFAFISHGYGHLPETATLPVLMRLDGFTGFQPWLAEEIAHD